MTAAVLAGVVLLAALVAAFALGGGPRPAGTPAVWVLTGQRPPFEFDPYGDLDDLARLLRLQHIFGVTFVSPASAVTVFSIGGPS